VSTPPPRWGIHTKHRSLACCRPGSISLLAGGLTYASGNPGTDVVAAIYQYTP
jgi:hypothetical protein